MRLICTAIIVALIAIRAQAANTPARESSGTESLGGQLLDDLVPGGVPPAVGPPANELNNRPGAPSAPAQPRFDDVGEDIGQASGSMSLVRVRQGMQQAEGLLGQPSADALRRAVQKAGETQQDVVAQLDKLIAELSKQCQGGQCKPGDQPPKPSQRSQAKPGKSGSPAGRGKTAARESTDRLDRSTTQPVDKGDINELVKDLWGHLPEREREQMLQSFSDEFLPKYELQIEQYYRRLSEEQDQVSK
jgi:hypothetical protein